MAKSSTADESTKRTSPGSGRYLRHTWLVWKRELGSYFSSPIAYVFIAAFLLGCGFLFVIREDFFARGQATVAPLFKWMPWLLVILAPAITMGVWSKERNSGTIEVLTTLPIRLSEIVIGKFLGAWSFICVAVLFTLPIPLLVSVITEPGMSFPWAPVVGSYIGTFLLGAAFCSLGLYVSSLTRNQILAFVVTLLLTAIVTFLGENQVISLLSENWPGSASVVSYVSPRTHFEQIAQGVLHIKSVVYFLSATIVFLFLNHSVLRGWKYTA
jgi:ABC-2 type transport system permease protein